MRLRNHLAQLALVMSAVVLNAACGSTPPLPSGGAPSVSPGTTPGPSGVPAPSGGPAPSGSGPLVTPGPIFSPVSLATALIPGLPLGSDVQLRGNEYLAEAHTSLNCDAFAGWLQAGDWIIDGRLENPQPSPAPSPDAQSPSGAFFSISRPGDAGVVRTGSRDSGCGGTITRLSRQRLEATGDVALTADALAYPVGCSPSAAQMVTFWVVYFGDDGTVASVRTDMPLALGDHQLTNVELRIGSSDRRPSNALDLFLFPTTDALDQFSTGLGSYAQGTPSSAHVTLTSIDPLIGTLLLTGLELSGGGTQSLTAGFRCDAPNHTLTDAANMALPTPTPVPTPPPAGHLEVQVGNAIDEQVDGPDVKCSFLDYGGGDTRWQLSYLVSPDALKVQLTVPASGSPFVTIGKGNLSFAADGSGGSHLEATVEERGSGVDFVADGNDFGGAPIHLEAQCLAVARP
jgi:hypothetical protein